MNWLVWRQHRKQFIFGGLTLLVFAIVIIITGNQMANTYHQALAVCSSTNTCADLSQELFQGDGMTYDSIIGVAIAAPLLLGLFWGAPLIAQEYEKGTNKLVWTQGVTRRKWLTVKLIWILFAAALYGAVITALVSWWSKTPNVLYGNRFDQAPFNTQGLMPIVYAIFATALGTAVGTFCKRVLLGLAVTLGIFVLVQGLVVNYARPNYETPITEVSSLVGGTAPASGSIWLLHQDVIDPSGKVATLLIYPSECKTQSTNQGSLQCLVNHGYHARFIYQPANRYWTFQVVESGAYLAASAFLVAVTYTLVLKRDA